ncbi:MAG: sulfotransferase, partial [Pseudomonadota bacterium]
PVVIVVAATGGAAILAVVAAFLALKIHIVAGDALVRVAARMSDLLDPRTSDEQKERAAQGAAGVLAFGMWRVLWRVAAVVAAGAAPIALAEALGAASADESLGFLLRLDVAVVATVLLIAAFQVWRRLRPAEAASANYSGADRLTHRLAFAGPGLQLAASALDDRWMAKRFADAPETPPVFVTSLPRAGTTVVLNALHGLPEAATHLYRDMPFVTAPLLWACASRRFAQKSELAERAHGDGLKVGFDSPEAFEELIWRIFWPQNYLDDHIAPWSAADIDPRAAEFLRTHFRKIIAARGPGKTRYVSKNNGNVARLPLLRAMFEGCAVVIPVRRPAEHAASLLRQHLNFATMQREDPFVATYMDDIGHLEFGLLHKPIAFEGFEWRGRDAGDPDYWLDYVAAAYAHALDFARGEGAVVVAQDRVTERPDAVMRSLCARCGLDPAGQSFESFFRAVPDRSDAGAFDPARLRAAEGVYEELRALSLS